MKLAHRGPDRTSELIIHDKLFIFHRLAIIDIESEAGPFVFNDYAMVCNGEVYNYKEFNYEFKSDVEVILRLIIEDPLNIQKLDGDFAFVISNESTTIAGRDPYGVRPLFYACDASLKIVGFASEAKALLGSHSVHVFPPGHMCVNGVFTRYTPIYNENKNKESSLLDVLTFAIKKRVLHSERPVALICSGGIDSAAIACIVSRLIDPSTVRVFTMKYNKGHSDDAFYASMLCNHLGFQHEIVEFCLEDANIETIKKVITACETCDENTIRTAIPTYLLAKHIAEKTDIKVVIGGEAMDELLGGYGYFRLASTPDEAVTECMRLLSNLHMFDLLRADRCFAAHGLEMRVPFLDNDLLAHVSLIPCNLRTSGEKQLLRDAVSVFPELDRFRILSRPKEKFSDGTGFSYVPDLLRFLAINHADDGSQKHRFECEKLEYQSIFTDLYGSNCWVVKRVMPSWTDEACAQKNASIIDA